MRDLSTTKSVTSSEVPVISFAARGTLLHDQPSFEKWCFSYFKHTGLSIEEEVLRRFLLNCTSELNERILRGESLDTGVSFFFEKLSQRFFPEADFSKKELEMVQAYRSSIKIVIPSYTPRVCEELVDRGYRLAVVTNEDPTLIEVMKVYNLLDLFEVIIFADEVGSAKPSKEIFQATLEDCALSPNQLIHVGDRYATDVLGARSAQVDSILYDPRQYEILALNRFEDTSDKVVSIDALRKNRALNNVKIISKFEELLEFFK